MIIMSMMKEKWQADAREDALAKVLMATLEEARAERAEARELLAKAMAEAREERAASQEAIMELIRQLGKNGGENANGVQG